MEVVCVLFHDKHYLIYTGSVMTPQELIHEHTYAFPSIRGRQAGMEYYVTMCPLELLSTLFFLNNSNLPRNLRTQRTLNKDGIPQLSKYILENSDNYILSSITASIDREVKFKPYGHDTIDSNLGTLFVPMNAKILINDGQHRKAAIEKAIKKQPALANETISVVFFIDIDFKRSQQMFADLNHSADYAHKSQNSIYSNRTPLAKLVNRIITEVPVFQGMIETSKSSISNRSKHLFTISSIYQATKKLLYKKNKAEINENEKELAIEFWNSVALNMYDWQNAASRKIATSELRSNYVHAHGIILQALAIAGHSLIDTDPTNWKNRLVILQNIDWRRSNNALWEGRALVGGRLSKSNKNVILTANVIKNKLGLQLNPNEVELEKIYQKNAITRVMPIK